MTLRAQAGWILLAVLAAPVATAMATDFYWQGAGTGASSSTDPADPATQWGVAGNWGPSGPPALYDDVWLTLTNPGRVYLDAVQSMDQVMLSCRDPQAALVATGGTTSVSLLAVGYEPSGVGRFIQNGGTVSVCNYASDQQISIGLYAGSTGCYELSGGLLASTYQYVGDAGAGSLIQTGGTNRPYFMLAIGAQESGSGAYELHDGYLEAQYFRVDRGSFLQTGGSTRIIDHHLSVGDRARIEGGTLDSCGLSVGSAGGGTLVQAGGSVLLRSSYGANSSCVGASAGEIGSLQLQDGLLTNQAGLCLGLEGSGEMVQTGGTHQAWNILLGSYATGAGTYRLSNGSVSAHWLYAGGCGRGLYDQSGGSARFGVIDVGNCTGGSGAISLSGGLLSAFGATVGVCGSGAVYQSGGTMAIEYDLAVGGPLYQGSVLYELSGGLVQAGSETVGSSVGGSFVQTGGTHTVTSSLTVGPLSGTYGTFDLGNGRMDVYRNLNVYGGSLASVYRQSGGTCKASYLYANAMDSGLAPGRVELSGGSFEAFKFFVGAASGRAGSFTQTGGQSTATHSIVTTSSGVCTLSGGTMTVRGGIGGSGRFNYDGGVLNPGASVTISNFVLADAAGSVASLTLPSACRFSPLRLTVGRQGRGEMSMSAGAVYTSELELGSVVGSSGLFNMLGGTLYAGSIRVGPAGQGRLQVAPGAVAMASTLVVGNGRVDGTVRLGDWGGAVDFLSVDPQFRTGMEQASLHIGNGIPGTWTLEAAGADLGAVAEVFAGNNALGDLVLGCAEGGAILQPVDARDNRPDVSGPDAVYVRQLAVISGELLNPDGLHVYYLNGGAPKLLRSGDANLDGVVNVGDLGVLAAHWGVSTRLWGEGDFNGNGTVDVADLGTLAGSWGATPVGQAQSVPEPASAALLAMMAAGVGWMRRGRSLRRGQGAAVVLLAATLSLCPLAAMADEHQWQGAGTGGNTATDVTDPTTWWAWGQNWAEPALPSSEDAVLVNFTNAGYLRGGGTIASLSVSGTGGTMVLDGAAVMSVSQQTYLGSSGTAWMVQTDGESLHNDLYLGGTLGATGCYQISGGLLSTFSLWSGKGGMGQVTQSGNSLVDVGTLYIGYGTNSTGNYTLTSGSLKSVALTMGSRGSFILNGGTHKVTNSFNAGAGSYQITGGLLQVYMACNGGTFLNTGGTHTVSREFAPSGYRMTDGLLTVGGTTYTEKARVQQEGGTANYASMIYVGSNYAGEYLLSGGVMTAPKVYLSDAPGTLFSQTGGSARIDTIYQSAPSTWRFGGGTLRTSSVDARGAVDFAGGFGAISSPDGSTLDFSTATLTGGQNTSMDLGANCLAIFPAGIVPETFFAHYSNLGITHALGQTLTIPAGRTLDISSTINESVWVYGTLLDGPSNRLLLRRGLHVYDGGSATLGSGSLRVIDQESGLDNGVITADSVTVNGRFEQTAGSMTASGMWLGTEYYMPGTFVISGGRVTTPYLYVGSSADGSVSQSGGSVLISQNLSVPQSSWGGRGSYRMTNGYLRSSSVFLGGSYAGTFAQDGGTQETTEVTIEMAGLMTVGGGSFKATRIRNNAGTFRQAGGSTILSGTLSLGPTNWSDGSTNGPAECSGGYLYAPTLDVARGTLTQTGGTVKGGQLILRGPGTAYRLGAGLLDTPLMDLRASSQFEITDASARTRLRRMTLAVGSGFAAVPGSRLDFTYENAGLSIAATDDSILPLPPDNPLTGLNSTTFAFSSPGVATAEASCRDVGLDPSGWDAWLHLAGLIVGGGTGTSGLLIVDYADNLLDYAAQALYVDNLEFLAGGYIEDAPLNLYYRNGGSPKRFIRGDATLDGMVNVGDLGVLAGNWGAAGASWSRGDFNGDRIVNVGDLAILASHWGGVTPNPPTSVPEPTSALLLAGVATAAMSLRRRHPKAPSRLERTTMMKLLAGLVLLGAIAGPAAAATVYDWNCLGTIDGERVYGSDLNNLGQVCGYYYDRPASAYRVTLWTPGGTDGVPTNPQVRVLNTSGRATAEAINDDGLIVGSWDSQAFVYRNGTMTKLGTFGYSSSSARDVNNNGQVLVSAYDGSWGCYIKIWQDGQPVVGVVSGASDRTWATCINESGVVAGRSNFEACIWGVGTFSELTAVNDMNDRGMAVGSGPKAFLWRDRDSDSRLDWGETEYLLPMEASQSSANAINNAGQVVGYYSINSQYTAFIYDGWDPKPLQDLMAPGCPYALTIPEDINDLGQILCEAKDLDGRTRYVVLTPRETALPEPATLALVALGAWASPRRRRRV